jgi:hypothetical protein
MVTINNMRTVTQHFHAPIPFITPTTHAAIHPDVPQQLLSMIYRRNKVPDGTIKMSDTEEHSLQNKTETVNTTTVNVDKMHFKNLLIVSASLKADRQTQCHSGETRMAN